MLVRLFNRWRMTRFRLGEEEEKEEEQVTAGRVGSRERRSKRGDRTHG